MGNRIGSHKQKDQRTKDEKKKDKDLKKEKEKLIKKEKKERKKKPHGSGLDADLDDSSHVTGGDSESCVFHSAENISASPYLDACTRSELEQGSSWSGMYESFTSASQHPQVLSAKDFKDGFSLEACLPPEIARPHEQCEDASSSTTSRFEGRGGSSVRSRKSNTSVKSGSAQPRSLHDTPTSFRSQHGADDVCSVGTSSQISGGYHTPLLSTPVFGRADAPISPSSVAAATTLSRVSETDPNDCMDISPATSTVHHPHFYNHQKLSLKTPLKNERSDFRNLPKPASPHPQRRALSPKMTSSPIKLISSDDSSSSHTTPTPQRRANILDLFRSGSKKSKTKESGNNQGYKSSSGNIEPDSKEKGKPLWKTWERSKAIKTDKTNKTSIFGTTRKSNKNKTDKTKASEKDSQLEKNNSNNKGTVKCETGSSNGNSPSYKYQKSDTSRASSSMSSGSHHEGRDNSKEDSGLMSSSSPIARSAAFCIMKLEELERSIEETIREKFPDAEPFLLKKRSREDETRGSRSLPSTPSLNKKLYIARDANDSKRNSQKDSNELADPNGKTRYCDETFEVCPSPAMSPVILRRFGARTRHASISPKIPRAKTAVLYNSPSEISSIEKSVSTITVPKVPVYHAVSSYPHQSPANSTQFMKPLKSSQKSESKYDNVIDESEMSGLHIADSQADARFPSGRSNSEGDEEDNSFGSFSGNDSRNVIVPTFSAVFGSVSPKLKRHLQTKFEENKLSEAQKSSVVGGKSRIVQTERSESLKTADVKAVGPKSTHVSKTFVQVPSHLAQDSLIQKQNKNVEIGHQQAHVQSQGYKTEKFNTITSASQTVAAVSTSNDVSCSVDGQVSVRQRVTTLNRTMSGGQPSTNVDLITGSNSTGVSVPAREQVSATSHCSEPAAVQGVPPAQRRTRTRANAGSPRVQQHQQASGVDTKAGGTEKSTVMISPGAQRKHSTDHVVFGSAVALPCRLYSNVPPSPTSKYLEETGNEDTPSTTQVSRENIAGQSQNVKYIRKQQIELCEVDKAKQKGTNTYTTESENSSKNSSSTLTSSNVIQSVLSFNISAVKDKNKHLDLSSVSSESISHASVKLDDNNSSVSSQRQDAGIVLNTRRIVQDDYKPSFKEDEQRYVVLKNPVSKVISEMINSSKQEEQQEKQRLEQHQHQTRQLHQSSPGYGVKLVEEAIATVRSPAYEQACLTLEEKTVRSDSSVSLPSSPTNNKRVERDFSNSDQEVKESRSQEIQTDSITTADKGVDSNSLTKSAEFKRSTQLSKGIPMVRDVHKGNAVQSSRINNEESNSNEDSDHSSSDEIELFKNVLASKNCAIHKKNVVKDDDDSEQAPHPSSPTAMQQLIEEFEEEEEENAEAMERKEIEMALRRESEIKEFTDQIYNRLSSLLGSQEEMEDNVFDDDVKETPTVRGVDELLSRLETKRESPYTFSSSSSEDDIALFISGSSKIPASDLGQSKIFTLETSSSLTTTTSSSESDPYEEPPLYQPPSEMLDDFGVEHAQESGKRFERDMEPNVLVFPEIETANDEGASVEMLLRRSSREYHSDDDVATGKGIPDYYDDRPLWTRRQKTPGQLSAAMMAIRRRERRERWLKKRKRNRTDLLSTGSSDTGSELALNDRTCAQQYNDTSYYNYGDDEFAENEKMIQRQEMGSGMLTSPKYSKPILPFGNSIATQRSDHKKSSPKLTSDRSRYRGERSKSLSGDEGHFSNTLVSSKIDTRSYDDDAKHGGSSCEEDEQKVRLSEDTQGYGPGSNLAIPGIEETFHELMSVKHILEGIQNRTPANETSSSVKCMPLTTENVKSIREYYKDCYSSGRRSRMSAADRTESDLDLYSESRDDESTDSNFNADDEEDEDKLEPYATADEENAATSGSTGPSHRDSHRGLGDDDDSETNVVVSCTFYNSNAFPAAVVDGPALGSSFKTPSTPPVSKSSVMSTPKNLTPTAQASVLNSDEEFWAGSSAACEERYKQVITTADAVSSTFQNAREQMHEIQHHLQALRRQMEVLQDDLSTTTATKYNERP